MLLVNASVYKRVCERIQARVRARVYICVVVCENESGYIRETSMDDNAVQQLCTLNKIHVSMMNTPPARMLNKN